MAAEYRNYIQRDIQSLMNDAIMIESSLSKKTIWFKYQHVNHKVAATVMIMPLIKASKYFSDIFIKRLGVHLRD